MKQGGTLATYATNDAAPKLPFWPMVFQNIQVNFLGSDDLLPAQKTAAAAALNAALEAGWTGFVIGERVPLAEVARAQDLCDHPERPGAGRHHDLAGGFRKCFGACMACVVRAKSRTCFYGEALCHFINLKYKCSAPYWMPHGGTISLLVGCRSPMGSVYEIHPFCLCRVRGPAFVRSIARGDCDVAASGCNAASLSVELDHPDGCESGRGVWCG